MKESSQRQLRADGRHSFPGKSSGAPRDRAERFVELMGLLADGHEWPARQLSEELNVSVRTIHRDMQLLKSKGLAIRKRGKHGSYRLVREPAWERPLLNPRELIALFILAQREAAVTPGADLALEATIKIIGFQPEKVRRPLLALHEVMQRQPEASRHWLCRQSWLPVLLEGIVETRPLLIQLTSSIGSASEPMEIMAAAIDNGQELWILQSHHVSPRSGEVSIELAHVASVEFAT